MSKSQSPELERWREELLQSLARQRVPPKWRDRLIEELEDHLSDLKENQMSMDANLTAQERLGTPDELASAAAGEYRKLGFFARRPVLTYVLGPLLLVPILFAVFLLVTIPVLGLVAQGIFALIDSGYDGNGPHAAGELIAWAITMSFRFVPFALFAWLFCWLARRQARDWRAVMSACATISVYAALLFATIEAPTATQKGTLIIGLALPPRELLVVVQAIVPLAIGAIFLWRTRPHAIRTACSGE
jgi:hypothetical protein